MVNDFVFILKEYFREILSVIGAISMFFIGKKKRTQIDKEQNVNIVSGELDNVETALKIYRVTLDDLQSRLTEAQTAYIFLEKRFQRAVVENKKFKEEINTLEEQNKLLSNKLINYEKNGICN